MAVSFAVPVDIANRALQHCGAKRISSFGDNSKNASSVSFCYDKLRRAELRRNVWRFATRRTVIRPVSPTTANFVPGAWSNSATYLFGSIVSYSGLIYQAKSAVPANEEPDITSAYWDLYFGPLTMDYWGAQQVLAGAPPAWSSLTNYPQGYEVAGSDGYVYYSLANGNMGNNPVTDGGVHWYKVAQVPVGPGGGYFAGELVYIQGTSGVYLSMVNSNSSQPPAIPEWVNTQTYSNGQTVTYSSTVYQSTEDFNLDNTPTGTGPWITQPGTQPDNMIGTDWLYLGAATYTQLNINYPADAGPSTQTATRNVYVLPNGYLREAPQDPTAGSTSFLGAPSGRAYDDWTFEGNFLITRWVDPIIFRFVADIANVAEMDDMFCEGLAARIATEIVEDLTQSAAKLGAIGQQYTKFMGEARAVNGIETRPVEPAVDDYIMCRI